MKLSRGSGALCLLLLITFSVQILASTENAQLTTASESHGAVTTSSTAIDAEKKVHEESTKQNETVPVATITNHKK